ncbi:threonyl-trna synthetase [Pseudohyphozyma bogoriensis]|nr:threonyl-trna synthetase [Pseudohyphozyma bogoriensis]
MAAAAPHPVSSTSEPAPPATAAPAAAAAPATKAPKAPKEKKGKKGDDIVAGMYALELDPKPEYLAQRITMFEKFKKEYDDKIAAMPREPITVTLPDGAVKEGTSWETTPMSIALGIAKSLGDKVVIAKVDGELWDLERPFEKSGTLELLDFDHPEGKKVWWHSSAHIVGECCERHYGCHLAIGPPTDEGFYYEMGMTDERAVAQTDYPALETLAKNVVKEKQKFERLVLTKEQLLEMFAYNPFKVHIIKDKIPDGTSTTVYRNGTMIDLCRGPHIPHTGRVKSLAILKNSASYFLGDPARESLQRIYGISFPDGKQMTEYKKFLEEAAKRDHRRIGKDQELFFFHELSPGSAFWLPHGTRIYNTLVEFMRSEYRKRNYQEVISPNMYNSKLWETSGHWQNYADDMFKLDVEKEQFALKPMNCPGHCLIFASRDRSYKELPIRMADFGVLHRNEASGALSGLTRVRRFQQDDAHHFCMPEQIEEEMTVCFDFLNHVYGIFGFEFNLKLSTRPENYLGKLETWDAAEAMLGAALDKFVPGKWEVDPGDGAFYGPKIDITISDALKRKHQCATIQLDYQLPQRFDLSYRSAEGGGTSDEDKRVKPVMIHRAILGSVERFVAILTEHFAGKWPFWLSPRQVLVIPVAAPHKEYASKIQQQLWDAGLYSEVDLSDNTLPKKIRNGELAQHNFILVVGSEEVESNSVNVRNRDDVGTKGKAELIPFPELLEKMLALKENKSIKNQLTTASLLTLLLTTALAAPTEQQTFNAAPAADALADLDLGGVFDTVKTGLGRAEKWVHEGLVREFGKVEVDSIDYELITHQDFPQYQIRMKEPSLCDSSVKSYSGYLDIDEETHLFFWFFESRKNPAKDPVVMWLNGGPGCSSSTGLLFELGPCSIANGGENTTYNPHSWTESANMIFLDQPVQVGYSWGGKSINNSPDSAKDVYAFMQLFYEKFPKWINNDFHVSGESYAGTYIPHIGSTIHEYNKAPPTTSSVHIPLKSLLIGNGLTDSYTQFASIPEYACDSKFAIFDDATCDSIRGKVPTCQKLTQYCYSAPSRFTCVPATLSCWQIAGPIQQSGKNPYDVRKTCDREGEDGPLCYKEMQWIETYLNKPEIKAELGAPKERTFESCNMQINQAFMFNGDVAHNTAALIPSMLEDGIKILIYAGEADFMCNYLGNLEWTQALEWTGKANYNLAKFKEFKSGKKGKSGGRTISTGPGSGVLTYLQVYDAGHMVPFDQPEVSLDFFTKWINDEPLA